MASGQQTRVAINNGTTWGTAVDCRKAGCGIYINSYTAQTARAASAVKGTMFTVAGQRNTAGINVTGAISAPFAYEHAPRLLHMVTAGAVSGPGPTYVHKFPAPTAPRNAFLTIAEQIPQVGGATIYRELPSAVATQMVIRATLDGGVGIEFQLIGDKVLTPAGVNIAGVAWDAVTFPSVNLLPYMAVNDTDFFKIAAVASQPVNFGISGFTFTYDLPKEAGDQTTASDTVGLPDESDNHAGTLEIEIPDYDVTTYPVGLLNDTIYNAVITMPTLAKANDNCLATIKFPKLQLTEAAAPQGGPGKLRHSIKFDVLADPNGAAHADADTTGGVAWEIAITNTLDSDYATVVP